MKNPPHNSWYREPWPWLLMAGPFLVIVGGLYATWLAVHTDDGLVAEDYYKQGLAINRILQRERAAARLNIHAHAVVNPDHKDVRIRLDGGGVQPRALRLYLVHPTRAGIDQVATLQPIGGQWYEGTVRSPQSGQWQVVLEDTDKTWRINGEWAVPSTSGIRFDAN